jgi:DNA-binding NtrC family response regulator/ligand-binding sensor domain-containing protein
MSEEEKMEMSSRGKGILEHFTMREGLPDMKIECIAEDSEGVLWIGTHDRGVVRYEGDEFQVFSRREGLAGNGVFSIIEDRSGHLWFGTDGGVTRFDGNVFEVIDPGVPCSFLWGSCLDAEGQVWFGLGRRPGFSPALCRWNGEQLDLVEVTDEKAAAGESIHKVVCDGKGMLWLGGERLYRQVDGERFEVLPVSYAEIGTIADLFMGDDGDLQIATERGIWAYREENLEKLFQENERHGPAALLKIPSGSYWIVTYDGRLLSFDGSRSTVVHCLNAVVLGGLCLDRSGRLWIGTYGMGLYCYDATRIKVFGVEQGLPANAVECIAEDGNEVLWFGTQGGLVQYDGQDFVGVEDEKRLGQFQVTGLLVDSRNRLWASTRNANLFVREDGQTELAVREEGMRGYRIDSLAEDGAGRIWFGSPYGKGFGYWADGEVCYFGPEEGAEYPVWIGALAADGEGCVWLGSSHPAGWNGLCHCKDGRFEQVEGVSGSSIQALYVREDGDLWIGTNEGLNRLGTKGHLRFTQADGLSCEIVTALMEDRDGTLWIGTEGGGVCCYDGSVFQVIQIPGEPGCDVIHAIQQDHSGKIWWGTEGGLIQYSRRDIRPEVEIAEIIADTSYPVSAEVQFSTSVGRVRFCFRGKSAQEHSSYLVYRYRLEGFEEDWRQTRDRQVEYPQLKPGEYAFTVQAVDRDLNYSKVAEIRLLITEDPRIEGLTEALSSETIRGEFIGESVALTKVKRQIKEVAWTDLTVLVLGETGTGKGLAARAIHALSERKGRPFIHVNCGGLQRDLVESDLFGHEKGAFTGAVTRKLGKFELAEGGTIFLDEIGDLPIESQTKLLHVLQEHFIERLGGTRPIHVDVRVIAATNRELEKTVRQGNFRADLYYRLNVFPVIIPPLRERREDIPLLARHFVSQFASHLHQQPPFIHKEATELLLGYEWPGNVRELEHTLQRGVILAGETGIDREHINIGPGGVAEPAREEDFTILPLEEFERRYLERVLDHTNGVIHGQRGAALLLGMKPTTLRSRLEKLGLK